MSDTRVDLTLVTGTFQSDDFDRDADLIQAALFGLMLKQAAPIVQHYHSDLYHDALWLRRHFTGPFEFDWLCRQSGTNIGESAALAVQAGFGAPMQFFRIGVTTGGRRWQFRLQELAPARVLERFEKEGK